MKQQNTLKAVLGVATSVIQTFVTTINQQIARFSSNHTTTETGDVWWYAGEGIFQTDHTWKNHDKTLKIKLRDGAAHHQGFVIEVTSPDRDATLSLSNGFISNQYRALIIADMYMRDDMRTPTIFMPPLDPSGPTSDKGLGDTLRQDEWLDHYEDKYEFGVINPENI